MMSLFNTCTRSYREMVEQGGKILAGAALHRGLRPPRSAATCSPTARSSRPRRPSPASTSSKPATSTTRSRSRSLSPIVEGGVEVRPLLGFEVVA